MVSSPLECFLPITCIPWWTINPLRLQLLLTNSLFTRNPAWCRKQHWEVEVMDSGFGRPGLKCNPVAFDLYFAVLWFSHVISQTVVKTDVLQVLQGWDVWRRCDLCISFLQPQTLETLLHFLWLSKPTCAHCKSFRGQSSVNVTDAASPASLHFPLHTCCNVSGARLPLMLFRLWGVRPNPDSSSCPSRRGMLAAEIPSLLHTCSLPPSREPLVTPSRGGTFYWLSFVIFSKTSKVAPPPLMSLGHLCDRFSGHALVENTPVCGVSNLL